MQLVPDDATAPTTTPTATPPTPPALDAPGLRWGIKQQFLGYIARMPDGRCWVGEPAAIRQIGDDLEYYYAPDPESTFDPATGLGELRYRGDVRFAGHHGFLFVRVADPWITVGESGATLSIAGTPDGMEGRMELATLALTPGEDDGGVRRYTGADLGLTQLGSVLFNEAYAVGDPLDELEIRHRVE